MFSYSNFPTINYFTDVLPKSQLEPSNKTDAYVYVRRRFGQQMVTASGERFGPYLYRNTRSQVLFASWDMPTKSADGLYSAGDIGLNADALVYYKNI